MGRSRDRRVTAAEARLWRTVVKDAVPLPGRALPAEDEVDDGPPVFRPAPPTPPPQKVGSDEPRPMSAASQHPLTHGHTPGIDRRTADRLRRGQMEIEARIDLHGMTQDAAHAALTAFIGRCRSADKRCVLVITGKGQRDGQGVLRRAVPRWLNEPALRAAIIAFTHAQPRDGGEGALYVLLKRRR